MAKFIDNMLNLMKLNDDEDEYDDEYEYEEEVINNKSYDTDEENFSSVSIKKPSTKVVNIHATTQMKVVVINPEKYDDAQEICDHIKSKKPVVINLELMNGETAQRIIDFLSGAAYALDGDIQKVANNIFIIAPQNVDISGNFKEELKTKGIILPWIK